jgi:hypothetical protein
MVYRIGSTQGFYGDDVTKALPMIVGGHVDILCFEALSELTLAILQKDKLTNPKGGYTFDVKLIAQENLPEAFKRKIPLKHQRRFWRSVGYDFPGDPLSHGRESSDKRAAYHKHNRGYAVGFHNL